MCVLHLHVLCTAILECALTLDSRTLGEVDISLCKGHSDQSSPYRIRSTRARLHSLLDIHVSTVIHNEESVQPVVLLHWSVSCLRCTSSLLPVSPSITSVMVMRSKFLGPRLFLHQFEKGSLPRWRLRSNTCRQSVHMFLLLRSRYPDHRRHK